MNGIAEWTDLRLSEESPLAVDRLFAEVILKATRAQENFAAKCFLAFLLAASRSGHLFVEIRGNEVIPSAAEIWGATSSLDFLLIEGAHALPKEILATEEGEMGKPIVFENNRYHLHRFHRAKKICQVEWQRLSLAPPSFPFDAIRLKEEMELLKKEGSLTDEQLLAVEMSASSSLFILTGGPGTGKTFTAARILRTLWRSLSSAFKSELNVAVTAPTGKAALSLHSSLCKALEGESLIDHLHAKTVHALLGLRSESLRLEGVPTLPCDVILIDEASMIDVELMSLLLSAFKSGAKVLMIGDPFQLPPVEGPPIFRELAIDHLAKVSLTRCLRTESMDLVDLALHLREENSLPSDWSSANVKRIDKGKHPREVLSSYLELFPRQMEKGQSPEELLTAFQKFRVLTPVRRGLFGVDLLNHYLVKVSLERGASAFPLLVTANDYGLQLFNGEVGVLLSEQSSYPFRLASSDLVHFPNGRKVPALLMPRHELGYAMTVHKSQGSEFEEVLLFLPKEKEPYGKGLIYTAITRARKGLTIAS